MYEVVSVVHQRMWQHHAFPETATGVVAVVFGSQE